MTLPDDRSPRERLDTLPRRPLGQWPSPLHPLPRFSQAVGCEVWIKRDDIGPVGLAGNKVRKFELLLGAAMAEGADTIITTGAAQSNSARTAAAAAAQLGLRCVLVLTGDPPPQNRANVLLDRLFGAEVRFVGPVGWAELPTLLRAVAEEGRAEGRRPFIAPVGASSPLGSLGFAQAYLELRHQLDGLRPRLTEPVVVHTSTSGGTHAGLVVGRAVAGGGPETVAIDAGGVLADPGPDLAALATAAGALIGLDHTFHAAELEVHLNFAGDGYGRPSPEGLDAIRLLARTEGIVCDPVYSGKGLAGLIALARSGRFADQPALFWHTGGWHALFDPQYGDTIV